jgi:catechol 2,3-dioxygenase-like lactoylglutathione lyase family enzyme
MMAQISGIAHACINVSDVETSKKWYQEVLGLTLVSEFKHDLSAGVGIPNAHVLGATLQWGEGENLTQVELINYLGPLREKFDPDTPIYRIGCSHVAFAVENGIDELYKGLMARGVEFYSPPQAVDVGGTIVKFCYFKDPDGIPLELIGT